MKYKHPFFLNSMCRNSYLHRFEIVEEYDTGVLEICGICGKKKFFKIMDGKVNNMEYMAWHLKQALPSFHPYYLRQQLSENEIISPYA